MTVVGSGTVVPNPERRQSCVAVECGGELIVFDLGSGALRGMLRAGLDPLEVDRVFLTHFHPDHTVDLPALLFTARYGSESPRTRPLHVCGPEPFAAFWDSLSGAWGEWISGDYLRITELPTAAAIWSSREARSPGVRCPTDPRASDTGSRATAETSSTPVTPPTESPSSHWPAGPTPC